MAGTHVQLLLPDVDLPGALHDHPRHLASQVAKGLQRAQEDGVEPLHPRRRLLRGLGVGGGQRLAPAYVALP